VSRGRLSDSFAADPCEIDLEAGAKLLDGNVPERVPIRTEERQSVLAGLVSHTEGFEPFCQVGSPHDDIQEDQGEHVAEEGRRGELRRVEAC